MIRISTVAIAAILLPSWALAQEAPSFDEVIGSYWDQVRAPREAVSQLINPDGSMIAALMHDASTVTGDVSVNNGSVTLNTTDIVNARAGLLVVIDRAETGDIIAGDGTVAINDTNIFDSNLGAAFLRHDAQTGRLVVTGNGSIKINSPTIR